MSNVVTLPGLIDCHVHFREPGFPHKGTMKSEAASAKAGGVLTVCDMPNTNPPPQTVEVFVDKVAYTEEVEDCDIRIFFGARNSDHLNQLRQLWTDPDLEYFKKRCSGLKLFLENSTGDQKIDPDAVEEAFALCGELDIPLVAHCEDTPMNEAAAENVDRALPEAHSLMRPAASEVASIEMAINLARTHNTPFHVAHLSTAGGLELVRKAKNEGLRVTCEVAPHHLFLTMADYEMLGAKVKMNPPVRSSEDQLALWEGIMDGTVDCVATDHAPHTIEEKSVADHLAAPSGVPGVETMLPLLLTVAAGSWPHPTSQIDIDLELTVDDIVRLCFTNPNTIYRLGASEEPRIKVDLEAEWVIQATELHAKCGWTPYEGWAAIGRVV